MPISSQSVLFEPTRLHVHYNESMMGCVRHTTRHTHLSRRVTPRMLTLTPATELVGEADPYILSNPVRVPLTTPQITGRACVYCGATDHPLRYVGWLRVPFGDDYTSSPVAACIPDPAGG